MTTASTLYEKGVDEQLVMERTGHRSTTAVRAYKRTAPSLQKEVSDLLQPPAPKLVREPAGQFDLVQPTAPKVLSVQARDPGLERGADKVNEGVVIIPASGGENSPVVINIIKGDNKVTIQM